MMQAATGEPVVGPPHLAAGVAEIELQELVSDYWVRAGSNSLRPSQAPWPQRLRCLVLEQGEQLLVLFNADWGRWLRLVDETKALVAEAVPHRKVTVLCSPTNANHNIDFEGFYWGALDVRSRRHDPRFRAQLLAALRDVFTTARRQVRSASVAAGRGACGSLSVNCYWGDARAGRIDPTVSVLRFADPQGHPLAVLIHAACRGDDRVHGVISAGLAGATAAVVRQVYGPLPVFHLNGCGADHFPCFAEPTRPALEAEAGGPEYQAALAPYVEREYARFGRVLGGEVCKVLGELEVAGRQLLTLNERWRYTSWAHTAPGQLTEPPLLRSVTVPVSLQCAPLPPPEECDGRVRSLEAELRRLLAHLPRAPRMHDYPLRAEETSTPLYQAMEVGSARAYWGIVAGRAKLAAKRAGTRGSSGDVTVVALGREVAIVGVPGWTCLPTVEAIRARSPFRHTMVCDAIGPCGLGHIIPEAERALGGVHSANRAYTQDSIDGMVTATGDALTGVYQRIA